VKVLVKISVSRNMVSTMKSKSSFQIYVLSLLVIWSLGYSAHVFAGAKEIEGVDVIIKKKPSGVVVNTSGLGVTLRTTVKSSKSNSSDRVISPLVYDADADKAFLAVFSSYPNDTSFVRRSFSLWYADIQKKMQDVIDKGSQKALEPACKPHCPYPDNDATVTVVCPPYQVVTLAGTTTKRVTLDCAIVASVVVVKGSGSRRPVRHLSVNGVNLVQVTKEDDRTGQTETAYIREQDYIPGQALDKEQWNEVDINNPAQTKREVRLASVRRALVAQTNSRIGIQRVGTAPLLSGGEILKKAAEIVSKGDPITEDLFASPLILTTVTNSAPVTLDPQNPEVARVAQSYPSPLSNARLNPSGFATDLQAIVNGHLNLWRSAINELGMTDLDVALQEYFEVGGRVFTYKQLASVVIPLRISEEAYSPPPGPPSPTAIGTEEFRPE
jgi:hypothetical protein